jgi:hypothetical protein
MMVVEKRWKLVYRRGDAGHHNGLTIVMEKQKMD